MLMPIQIYAGQLLELYHSVVSCALNMEDLISSNFFKIQQILQ
jgi:hypothetical protein